MIGACDPAPASCGGNNFLERAFNWTVQPADRLKLWIDNKLLIDQWTSLDATSVTASHRFLDRAATLDFAAYFQRAIASSSRTDPASVSDIAGSPFSVVLP